MRLTCLISFLGAGAAWSEEPLIFEQRMSAQRAIERVYATHRTEPGAIVPENVLRDKVARTLKLSNALASVWGMPVTARALQAEMDRMASATRAPDRLREVFQALEDDPRVIAETFVRQRLVERLARHAFARDGRVHGATRQRAEAALQRLPTGRVADLRRSGAEYAETVWLREGTPRQERPGSVRLTTTQWEDLRNHLARDVAPGGAGPLRESSDRFYVVEVLESTDAELRLAVASWPKLDFDAWYVQNEGNLLGTPTESRGSFTLPAISGTVCTPGTWRDTSLDAPEIRGGHSAVWTGSEMIVWGGFTSTYVCSNSGNRYDPTTDTWSGISRGNNVPAPRDQHSAIWTGKEMIVWGGRPVTRDGEAIVPLATGGRYDPRTDTWSPMAHGEAGRMAHTAVWTGTEMIVWGGVTTGVRNGERYEPETDKWKPLPDIPGETFSRRQHTAVWTGTEMIVWGGFTTGPSLRTGARYDPARNIWTATSIATGVPTARVKHTAVWTGTEMIVWGGSGGSNLQIGGRYNPLSDTWVPTPGGTTAPAARSGHVAAWTGQEMLVYGGVNPVGGAYSPDSNTWRLMAAAPQLPATLTSTGVWTGGELIVWGGGEWENKGARYRPDTNTWTQTASTGAVPAPGSGHTAVWTGNEMIVWGGRIAPTMFAAGGRYDPTTDEWRPTSVGPGVPEGRAYHSAVWTGTEMIVWGGLGASAYLRSGGRYDPVTDSWKALPIDAGTPTARSDHRAIWTATEMIIWGGIQSGSLPGARYRPASDSWVPISTTDQPSPRVSETTIWTGREMIVFGGRDSGPLNTGARYDPAQDRWLPTAASATVPSIRYAHSAVWTGREMIVWGGDYHGGGDELPYFPAGERYDPVADTWRSMSPFPSERYDNVALWTGVNLIIWGGRRGVDELFTSGAQYDPSRDVWISTPEGPPEPGMRTEPTAVWTGSEMILWGSATSTGAAYCPLLKDFLPAPSTGPVKPNLPVSSMGRKERGGQAPL